MSYEIHLNISEDSHRGHLIAALASKQQISPTQAVERILDIVASTSDAPVEGKFPSSGAIVAEAMGKVGVVREQRSQEYAALSRRNESAKALIGLLKDEPETVARIQEAANDRRRQMYL